MTGRITLLIFTQFILFGQIAGQRFVFHTNSIKDSTSLANEEITYWGIFDVATCQASIFHERLAVEEFKDVVILPDSSIYTYSLGNRIGEGIGRFYPERRLLYFYPMPSFVDNKFVEALSCNGNGIIYGAGLGLTEFNPITRRHTYLGDLPREMQAVGDLTFRGGKLYLSTISNTLVEVNINNPINSRVVMTFPAGTPPIYAMTTVQGGCNEVVTYAVGTDSTGSIIYELDFENKTLIERCRTPWTIIGAASQQECVTPVCKVYVDLDKNNSSGGSRYDFHPAAVCSASVTIADQDLEVYAEEAIDSVIITLNGILDIGFENLTAAATNNLSVNGSGTNKITIVNLGNATVEDLRRAIARIFYKNSSMTPTNGNRAVWVRGYTRSYVGEISTARIRIENNLALEQDRISLKCYGDPGITFTARATGGIPPYKYAWANGDTIATRTGLAVGSYPISIADQSGCRLVDTVQVTQPDSLWIRIQAVNDSICGASGQLSALVSGGTAPYTYQWSHNTNINQNKIQNLEPGTYIISITDQSGCQTTGNYTLVQSDTLRTNEYVQLCTGEIFNWQGSSIDKDTSFCIRLTNVNGCDSLHCVEVAFSDTTLIQQSVMRCNNDTYALNGQIISTDTLICNTFIGANGCDSTYCLSIRVHKRINQFTALVCEGASYSFAGKTLTTAGTYIDTIQDGGSCDSLNCNSQDLI